MTRAPLPHPDPLSRFAGAKPAATAQAPLSLADLVAAVCTGLAPAQGIEALLDRVEGRA